MWPCSARQDSPHTQPHAGMLSVLFGSSPPPHRWYKEPCVTVSTPLLISCGPLSPDPLVGVLPTSQEGKNSLTGGRDWKRKGGGGGETDRQKDRERERASSHLQSLSQEFKSVTTAKASEPSYQMLLFLGNLKIKLAEGWARCPSGCCRKQEGAGFCRRGSCHSRGSCQAGSTYWLPLRRN